MYDRKLQVLAHVNGDAAIEQFLSAVEAAKKKSVPNKKSGFSNLDNYRTVSLHSQMASQAHLSKMVALKVIPSFFGAHAYYWGDWHRDETLGPERA
jgi:predicted amidohydrolase YtcJ